jgi:hypothetical protein
MKIEIWPKDDADRLVARFWQDFEPKDFDLCVRRMSGYVRSGAASIVLIELIFIIANICYSANRDSISGR